MIGRVFHERTRQGPVKASLLAAVALVAIASASYAQCSGGGGSGGGRMGGGGGGAMAGGGGGSTTSSLAQSIMAAQATAAAQAQFQGAQTQYVANMHAQHNAMLQQIHQRQHQQMLALRQASQNRKRAGEKTAEVSFKAKSARSTKSTGPSA
jgi:hypothetical protein